MISIYFLSGYRIHLYGASFISVRGLRDVLKWTSIDIEKIRVIASGGKPIGDTQNLQSGQIYTCMYNTGKPRLHGIIKDISINGKHKTDEYISITDPGIRRYSTGLLTVSLLFVIEEQYPLDEILRTVRLYKDDTRILPIYRHTCVRDTKVSITYTFHGKQSSLYELRVNEHKTARFLDTCVYDDSVVYRFYLHIVPWLDEKSMQFNDVDILTG